MSSEDQHRCARKEKKVNGKSRYVANRCPESYADRRSDQQGEKEEKAETPKSLGACIAVFPDSHGSPPVPPFGVVFLPDHTHFLGLCTGHFADDP